MRDDRLRLLDILEAIENIEEYVVKGRDVFAGDELVQVWMVHHIQIIGEAAAHLSQTLRQRYPNVPWIDIIAMRNVLVHHYFGIDLHQIWDTVTVYLPELNRNVATILQECSESS